MRWRRHRKNSAEEEQAAQDVQAAREALDTLAEDIEQAHRRTSEILEISRTLRRLGERNHFAPLIRDALGGKFQ